MYNLVIYKKMNATYEPAIERGTRSVLPKVIAVSDDDLTQRQLLVNILRRDGHEVQDFDSGVSLVSAIENGYRPNLVITDYQMPEMCGFEVAEWLSRVVPGIDVYMVTGSPDKTRLEEAKEKGILKDHREKPYNPRDIISMLSSYK